MMDLVREYWGIFIGGVAGLAWLMRLEGRSLSNEKEIKRLWSQRKEDMDSAKEQRDASNAMLAEIRSDVKAILRAKP